MKEKGEWIETLQRGEIYTSVGYKKENVGRTQSTPLPLPLQAGTRRLIFREPSSWWGPSALAWCKLRWGLKMMNMWNEWTRRCRLNPKYILLHCIVKLLCSAAFTSSLLPLGFANAWHHMNASCSLEPNKSYLLTADAHLNAYIASSPESTELFPGLPCFVLESGWSFYLYSHWLSALSLFHHPFLSFPFYSPFSFLQLPHTATVQVCVHGSEALCWVSTRSDERMNVCRFCCVSSKLCWTTHDTVLWQSHHSSFDL